MGGGASTLNLHSHQDDGKKGKTATYQEQTPMLIVPYQRFKAHGTIPRSNEGLAVPYSSLGTHRTSCFILFISHRWLLGHATPPHPDKENQKFLLICEAIDKMTQGLAEDITLFIWVDFACIDQDDFELKMRGISSLPSYIERCDGLLTPYTDATFLPPVPSDQGYENPFSMLWTSHWPSKYKSLAEYCNRAWCRLEMFVGSNAPLTAEGFDYFRRLNLTRNDRPHFVYGDHQRNEDIYAEILPKLSNKWYENVNPLQGEITDPSDFASIQAVVDMVQVERIDCEEDQYVGERNEAGQRHGQGVYRYESGACYNGSWKEDQKHGQGTMNYEDGACYVGEWKDGSYSGKGRMAYADGNIYEGFFLCGKHHGEGEMSFASNDRYEGGWKEGYRHGQGLLISADGGEYQGAWCKGVYEGYGVYTFPSGAHYDGMWKDGVKHGSGVYYCQADSDVPRFEGTYKSGKEEGTFFEIYPNGHKKKIQFENGAKISEQVIPANTSVS